jgi:hypothetical protein
MENEALLEFYRALKVVRKKSAQSKKFFILFYGRVLSMKIVEVR